MAPDPMEKAATAAGAELIKPIEGHFPPHPIPPPSTGIVREAPELHPYTRADMKRDYPQALQMAMDILSTRLLGLIALVTSCIVWGGVIYAPEPWRIAAAGAFSTLVFLPVVGLYWRAGVTGKGD